MEPILIVDDEAIVRQSIKDWLEDSGYQVCVAESGEEAIELIIKRDFSILIVDLRLPQMTGIDVLKKVKALKPNVRSIVITAYPTMLSKEEATKLGTIDYLVKPIFPDTLEALIRETLGNIDNPKKD